ncbi:reactive mitochondrial oxygen species modulator 1-domain-containing protein [Mycena rebaudengoi]|nr:reactive mitochondrial oxygen species modulator 1-domain-containing protein [Mycena rebaudengoi]
MSEPSVWQKMKMGALMGGGVGLTIGFLFGSWNIIQHGAGPRGVLSTLSKTMLSSAATFGFFLSIGSVIRNDSPILEAAHMQLMAPAPIVRSRAEGFQLMRARWEEERNRRGPTRP